jgi:hypothetical protein
MFVMPHLHLSSFPFDSSRCSSQYTFSCIYTQIFFLFRQFPVVISYILSIAISVSLLYEVLSESSWNRSKKKCCLNLFNFGCYLLQNSFLGSVYSNPIIFSHASKALWKSVSLMLSSTACDSLWMSYTLSKRPFNFILIWETKHNHGCKVR